MALNTVVNRRARRVSGRLVPGPACPITMWIILGTDRLEGIDRWVKFEDVVLAFFVSLNMMDQWGVVNGRINGKGRSRADGFKYR